ncbi:hypothetical protein SALBM135S_06294 [Streptomyces alboniger]
MATARGTLSDGQDIASGTLAGPKHLQKIAAIGEYDVDLALAEHMVVLRYADRPGVVGTVGRVLGESGVNIGGMQVARADVGGEALAVLTVETPYRRASSTNSPRRSVRSPLARST